MFRVRCSWSLYCNRLGGVRYRIVFLVAKGVRLNAIQDNHLPRPKAP